MRKVPTKVASKLYTAAELIADRGLGAAKIDDIAEATGIPKATLYYYFSGKEEIVVFLMSEMLDLLAAEVGTALTTTEGTALTRLKAAVRAQVNLIQEHPAMCRALLGNVGQVVQLPELANLLRNTLEAPMLQLFADGESDGSLRKVPDPRLAAQCVFGAIVVSAFDGMLGGPTRTTAELTENVLDVVLTGISNN